MKNYVFVYKGGETPLSPEDGVKFKEKCDAWVVNRGDTMISHGTPMGMSKTVSSSGVSENVGAKPLLGFAFIKAESMDDVLAIVKGCPFLEWGTIEVAEETGC